MKPYYKILFVAIFALVVLMAAPFFGQVFISPVKMLRGTLSRMDSEILFDTRVPRVIGAFIAGAALSLCGMAFQSLFRNPLATPFVLGVSAGGSFGATLALCLGVTPVVFGLSTVSLFAFGGATLSIAIVYMISGLRKGVGGTYTLLLAGVAINFFFSSLIMLLQHISDHNRVYAVVSWLMGSFVGCGYDEVFKLLPFAICGIVAIVLYTRELNLLSIDEEIAAGRGVDAARVKRIVFISSSLMVGGVVAMCGPVGFVGMMAPHICRMFVGPDLNRLAPCVLFFGGAFLVLCDTLAQSIIPAQLPVGVITSLLGGPFFVLLLCGKFKR